MSVIGIGVAQSITPHHDVGAPGPSEEGTGGRVLEQAELVGPRPGGVHHDGRLDHSLEAGGVLHGGAPHPAAALLQPGHAGVGGDRGAVLHRRAGGGHHQPGVVALRVVVTGSADQAPLAEHRLGREKRALAEDAVPPHIPERGEQVVQPHAGRQLPERHPIAVVDREHECQGAHQVRGDPEQGPPLPCGLVDQMEIALFEVP